MAGLFPLSRQQIFKSGRPVPGARLFLFDGGTTTPRTGYRDSSLTTAYPNPIEADADGRLPIIFLATGFYRQRLTTSSGTLIFDDDGLPVIDSTTEGSGTSVDPDSVLKTGDFKLSYNDQPQSGFVRANGRTIGSATSGATERANADTQPLYEHLWSYANISVSGGKGGSAAADFAANKALVLPNSAGRGLFGSDDLGAGAQSVLTSATITNPTLIGSTGGTQTGTIAASNLPVTAPWVPGTVSVSGSGTTDTQGLHSHNVGSGVATSGVSNTHSHTASAAINTASIQQGGGNAATVYAPTGSASSLSVSVGADTPDHAHLSGATTTDNQGSHAHNVTINSTGSVSLGSNSGGGQAFPKLNPVLTVMILIRL